MAALFACTKCHSRHPFESLSKSEQLCKKCRNYQPVVKCTLCRAEFSPGEKGATNDKCKHCTYNMKIYGEASVCQYCNLMAAFVDNKCQRCTAYLKKFGKPLPCEQCKMNCAFDKSEHAKKKADGKLLCWLCALAYKRVLAKALQRREEKKQSLTANRSSYDKLEKLEKKTESVEKVENVNTDSNSMLSNPADKISPFDNNSQSAKTPQKDSKGILTLSQTEKATPPSFASSFDFLREHKEEKSNDSSDVKVKEEPAKDESRPHRHHHHHHHHHHHKSKHHKRSHSGSHSPSKKSRIESSEANGMTGTLTPTKSSALATEKSPVDPNSSEHIIAINRLQEQLDNCKKQLSMKEQQLLEKDKKITEVKADQYEREKTLRTKITEVTNKSTSTIESLQGKNRDLEKKMRDLQKQVTMLSKGKKTSSIISSASNSQNNSPNISS